MKGFHDEIEKLKSDRNYGHSGLDRLQEERERREEREKAVVHHVDDMDGFIDHQEDKLLNKNKQKRKLREREDDDNDEISSQDLDLKINNDLVRAVKNMKVSNANQTKQAKELSEKENLRSKDIMMEMFDTLDKTDAVAPTKKTYQPAAQMAPTNKPFNLKKMDEENPAPMALEPIIDAGLDDDELEALERQFAKPQEQVSTNKMDLEPIKKEPAREPVQAYKSYPSQSDSKLQMNPVISAKDQQDVRKMTLPEILNFKKSLYTISKQKLFDLETKCNDDDPQDCELAIRDGYAKFYWTDIQEDFKNKSNLYIYGKAKVVLQNKTETTVSACLNVKNMERCYYIVKRDNDRVTAEQMRAEVAKRIEKRYPKFHNEIKMKIDHSKWYAFELDIARGNVEAIKVEYSFEHPPLDIPFSGETYHGVLGKTYKTSELFIIENRIMGPCWLDIKASDLVVGKKRDVSHCQIELSVPTMYDITTSVEKPKIPPMKALSVGLVKSKTDSNVINAIVGIFTETYDIENVQPTIKTTPLVFMIPETSFSKGGAEEGKATRANMLENLTRIFGPNIEVQMREFSLINSFCQKLARLDPDLIIGHDIYNTFFDVLIGKLEKLDSSMNYLNSLSKSKRDPVELKRAIKGFGMKKVRNATYGRMICDTQLSSQELIRETNYELDFLAEKHLGQANIFTYRTASSDKAKDVCHIVDEALMSASLALGLCQKFQLVQLNKQLTNVSGCFWYQSFQNLRAERNEMLLMHIFFRNHYIFPDKYDTKRPGEKKGKKREKAKYEGGLVLEPKSGLYQDFILLLDFNSLYPSIIREFKICFTTVEKRHFNSIEFYEPNGKESVPKEEENENEDDEDDDEDIQNKAYNPSSIPDHDHTKIVEGNHNCILPKIVKSLIDKRKEVKREIKATKDESMKETLDIKQKAYKLIANSIYGCLGFKNSRFFAKQIAALITSRGRGILEESSKEVGAMGFEVVYGDTDSLMINSKEKSLIAAIKIGTQIKSKINSQYKTKILEIELDGVFRSLLLLKKKKYAADKLQNLDDVLKETDGSGNVDQVAKYKIELKGLDIVRRDWSGITKTTGERLVELVLSKDLNSDDILSRVYDYLEGLKADMDQGKIPIDKFTIFKQLNKSTKEYNDKGQPHVHVAKAMIKSGNYTDEVLKRHFIPYIICKNLTHCR